MTAAPRDLLSQVLDQTHRVLLGAADADPGTPTPCRSWDLAALRAHVVANLAKFTVAAQGRRPDWSAPPPPAPDDPAAAFRADADELLAAWEKADLDAVVRLPFGDMPMVSILTQQLAEFAVHGWDVARATGQRVDWDSDVAATALAWARQNLSPQLRGEESDGKSFGPEVGVEADGSAQDRLVAWFGRDPAHPLG
jgi:uncharacterized protein (TIGR03086 family)